MAKNFTITTAGVNQVKLQGYPMSLGLIPSCIG